MGRKAGLKGAMLAACGLAVLAMGGPTLAAETPAEPVQVAIHADQPGPVIDRHIFGEFSEHLGHGIYGGMWVGENSPIPNTRGWRNDVIAALRGIKAPVIRWPGGCFADSYDWREGVGPRDKRPVRVNTNWGGVEEPNSVGTNEFLDFTEMVGADAYVNGDVGSAPPREMADWLEYMTTDTNSSLAQERRRNGRDKPWKVAYFGIGNETWGCGGNMRPEYAADVTRRYATFLKSPEHVLKLASGSHDQDYTFLDVLMREASQQIDGVTYHYYTIPTGNWAHKGSATDFGEDQWASTLGRTRMMDGQLTRQSEIMDKYDPKKRVFLAVDEWGVWTDVEPGANPGFLYQQNSLRDALVAATNFDIFERHADRVRMATIAQTVNVLQSVILTDGPKMVLTPTYYAFKLYVPFQDAVSLPVSVNAPTYSYRGFSMPAVDAAAARGKDGKLHIALVNVDPHHAAAVTADLGGAKVRHAVGQVLTAAKINSINTFDHPDAVRPEPIEGRVRDGRLTVTVPAKSIVELDLD